MEQAAGTGHGAAISISTIGPGVVVTGTLETDAEIRVEGRVVGDATCASLIIGENGSFAGRIDAERVQVRGRVEGAIQANDLAIESTARVIADVTYWRLQVRGGCLEGEIARRPRHGRAEPNLRLIHNGPVNAPGPSRLGLREDLCP